MTSEAKIGTDSTLHSGLGMRDDGGMAITPDTEDWTWVLERECPDCGFDSTTVQPHAVPALVRGVADEWPGLLERDDVRERPNPSTWSPLEYAGHVRDVFRVFGGRLRRMLDEDEPDFENWDQDAAAVDGRYGERDPRAVAEGLVAAGHELAEAFAAVPDDAWSRTGRRSDGTVFTVTSLARYLLHDVIHHVWDVTPSAGAQAE